ncbi:MAG: S8 family serine peptidase, partial [Deltaproteobacteria bacterium]
MIRLFALTLGLLVTLASQASAQYRVVGGACVTPGRAISVTGSFGGVPVGQIVLATAGKQYITRVRAWSATGIRVSVPSNVPRGATYPLVWKMTPVAAPGSPDWVALDLLTLCGDRTRPRVVNDVVIAPDGTPEYVVSVATGQAGAASSALQQQNATLLRTRALPQLGRTLLIFAFPGDLSLSEARSVLARAAPSARVDRHDVYGFADGPRLYAAGLVGDDPERVCGLKSSVAIGLIDGPVNVKHPALAGVSVVSTSVLLDGERPVAGDHGTAVAALMAGRDAGAFRGFAAGAQLYAVTAFSGAKGREGARLEDIAAGLDWLAGQNVRLVNLSMEGSPNAAFEDILSRAQGAGLTMIAAAGNEGTSSPRYPAASPSTIAVTAVDAAGKAYGA